MILTNHVTAYDGALILYALPPKTAPPCCGGHVGRDADWICAMRAISPNASQTSSGRSLTWLITALFNVFPLPRARGFRRSFAHAGEAMDRGYSVLIFPEGTRSQDGKLGRFRPGIGLLAEESRVPIVPIGLAGLGEIRARPARAGSAPARSRCALGGPSPRQRKRSIRHSSPRGWKRPCEGCNARCRIHRKAVNHPRRRAASLAKYVTMKSAPARRMEMRDSRMARSGSSQPRYMTHRKPTSQNRDVGHPASC